MVDTYKNVAVAVDFSEKARVVIMVETYHNVVVAIDFSEKAKIAFKRGVRIAKLTGATLHLVSVIDTHSFRFCRSI